MQHVATLACKYRRRSPMYSLAPLFPARDLVGFNDSAASAALTRRLRLSSAAVGHIRFCVVVLVLRRLFRPFLGRSLGPLASGQGDATDAGLSAWQRCYCGDKNHPPSPPGASTVRRRYYAPVIRMHEARADPPRVRVQGHWSRMWVSSRARRSPTAHTRVCFLSALGLVWCREDAAAGRSRGPSPLVPPQYHRTAVVACHLPLRRVGPKQFSFQTGPVVWCAELQ